MFSILLEDLPDSYRGILIRTSFRVGIQISTRLDEVDGLQGTDAYSDALLDCLELLYGVSIPEGELALDGLQWFMRGGQRNLSSSGNVVYTEEPNQVDSGEDEGVSSEDEILGMKQKGGYSSFDFYYDSGKIYSAFKKAYNIDLNTCVMHWFEFLYLMEDLGDCLLSKAIEYRTADISKLKGDQKKHYLRMRKKFTIPAKLSEQEVERIESTGLSLDDIEQYMQY